MTFHIERRVDNKGETHFRASTRVKGTDGELHRVRTSWRDLQREAKDDGEQLLEELAKPVRGDETVAALLERFMRDYCVPSQVAPTTRLNYRLAIDHHITGVWLRADSEPVQMGEIRAADLLAADVAEWQALQLTSGKSDGTGLGPKTVRGIRGVLGGAFSWAVGLGDYESNPVAAVKPPKLRKSTKATPTLATVKEYVAALAGTRYVVPLLMIAGTGMRRGEVLGQRWTDLDAGCTLMHLREQRRQYGNIVEPADPKTDAGTRDLTLPPFLTEALLAEKTRQQQDAVLAGETFSENALICGDVKPNSLGGGLLGALKRRSLPPIGMHRLRHMVATEMLANGMSVLDVQAQLGHSNPATTTGIYGHVKPGASAKNMAFYGILWENAEDEARTTASGEVADSHFPGAPKVAPRDDDSPTD